QCDRHIRALHSFPTRRSSDLTECLPLTYVRSSPSWKLLVQYSRGAPLSTPKKFSGLTESPCAPKEIVPKCSPGTKDKFLVRGSVDRKSTRLNSSHLGISYAVF